MAPRRIGEHLVSEGILSESEIHRALGFQRLSGERLKLGSILLHWDLLDEEALLTALSSLHRTPAVTWAMLAEAPFEAVRLLPAAHALRLGAIAWGAERGLVRVAFTNPSNLAVIDEVAALVGRRVVAGVTTEVRLFQAHQKFFGRHVPLQYRAIVQKLDRPAAGRPPARRDFRATDVVQAEREVRSSGSAGALEIPVTPEAGAAADDARLVLPPVEPPELPDLPELAEVADAPDAAAVDASPADDSLSDWVGEALSAFTDGPAARDPESPAGVADPSQFGRHGEPPRPGPLAVYEDDLPQTNMVRARVEEKARLSAQASPLTDEHRRGVPDSIPPFRRASDPIGPYANPAPSGDPAEGLWRRADDSVASPAAESLWKIEADGSEPGASEARSRDDVADSVLESYLGELPRVVLLGAGKNGITGWRGRAPGLTAEAVLKIRIFPSEISVFTAVQESGVPHFGAVDRSEWPRALATLFGGNPPECAIFPVRVLDGIAAFLYADRLGSPMQYEDFALVARAAGSAAGVLSQFLLRRRRSDTTHVG
ncbi:MAG: hypothetical protein ABI592_05320 [Acidobacteriota bacterium]